MQLAIKTFFYFVSSDKLHLRHSKKKLQQHPVLLGACWGRIHFHEYEINGMDNWHIQVGFVRLVDV
jgi:hypothetical protein